MTNPNINLNLIPQDPSLSDLLDLFKKEIFLNLNCHHLATVQSFDPATQTVTCTINYQKTIFQLNEQTQQYSAVLFNYPLLAKVPVVILNGGQAGLTFPITQGDQCLLLFNDRSIDNWFQSGQVGPVPQSRFHSLSDAIALVGIRNLNTVISAYDMTRALLFNGSAGVGVSSTKIKIFNGSTTLNTILQNILTQLEALGNSVAVNGNPIAPAVATQLAILATQLGTLIE